MKFLSPMIVVTDMEKSKEFYNKVFGLDVILDFGENVTLTGGIALQTKRSWINFINKQDDEIKFGGNTGELYFEEEDFDGFIEKITEIKGINYVHEPIEHSWGQRVIRLYDPDNHIIEVGENLDIVVKRFLGRGLSVEETAVRMDVPTEYIKSCLE